jgi:hypothetical protein
MRLAQRAHAVGQSPVVGELVQRRTARGHVACAGGPELFVPLFKVLRELFDDFRLALGAEAECGESLAKLRSPVRHCLLP